MDAPLHQPTLTSSPLSTSPVSEALSPVAAEELPHHIRPLHWGDWQRQIDQMIPRSVTLDTCLLYDWSPSLNPPLAQVDIYLYSRPGKYTGGEEPLKPLVSLRNPDLSFSRDMEDAVARFDESIARCVRDASTSGHRLVGIGPVVVYKNRQIQHPRLFGPTIDTLLSAAVIGEKVSIQGEDQQVMELGLGNGLISKAMLRKFHPQLKKLWATDLHGHVLNQGSQNVLSLTIPQEEKDKFKTVRDSTFLEDMRDRCLQLLVSNPPYIPDLRGNTSKINNAITGLEVYDTILGATGHRVLRTGGRVLTILSSVSADTVRQETARLGYFAEGEIYASKFVPFDLADIVSDKSYHQRLIGEGLVYRVNGRDYHKVEFVEFVRQ